MVSSSYFSFEERYDAFGDDEYDKIGLVNKYGKLVQEEQFTRVYEFDEKGFAKVHKDKEGYGLIDKKGKTSSGL